MIQYLKKVIKNLNNFDMDLNHHNVQNIFLPQIYQNFFTKTNI